MNFGAFILPNGKLKHEIMFWKGLVESNYPDQFYTKHLPHLTILNIKVRDINLALKKTMKTINDYNSFHIRIEKKGVFWNDFGTHGGHTLFYEVKKNQYILNLQKVLAESLTSEVIREKVSIYKKDYEMDLSYKKYGSPFIGEQWIPHFSVASLNNQKNNPVIIKFLEKSINFRFDVMKITFWKIKKNNHFFLDSIDLR